MNGLLIQWGTNTTSTEIGIVTFDKVQFTNTPMIIATAFNTNTDVGIQTTIQTSSNTNFTYWTGIPGQRTLLGTINWIAIGY